jgi:hypothetical protein
MRQLKLHALAAAALAAVGVAATPCSASAQNVPASRGRAPAAAPATPLAQLMAPWEREATGVDRLSAEEQRALEGWLARYTGALRAGRGATAPAAAPGGTQPAPLDTIRPAPATRPSAEPRPASDRPGRIALSIDPAPSTLEVVAVHEGGDLIETADGSLWETYLPDRFDAGGWRVGQQLIVRSNPLPPQLSGTPYDVVLRNGETRTSVAARYAGRQRTLLGAEDGGGR